MPRLLQNEHIYNHCDWGSSTVFSNVDLSKCKFENCVFSMTLNLARRNTVRNANILDCSAIHTSIGPTIIENTTIRNLSTSDILALSGCVFKHVTLCGIVGPLMIRPVYREIFMDATQQEVDDVNTECTNYYENVDWALDISNADFISECDIRSIPARLIRRDPETQAIVNRENVLDGRWKELELGKAHWKTSIEFMLNENRNDCVLIAPKKDRHFKELLQGIKILRDAGVAMKD